MLLEDDGSLLGRGKELAVEHSPHGPGRASHQRRGHSLLQLRLRRGWAREGEMESGRERLLSVGGFGGRGCVSEEGRKKVGRWTVGEITASFGHPITERRSDGRLVQSSHFKVAHK
jgi:hypothetical protein